MIKKSWIAGLSFATLSANAGIALASTTQPTCAQGPGSGYGQSGIGTTPCWLVTDPNTNANGATAGGLAITSNSPPGTVFPYYPPAGLVTIDDYEIDYWSFSPPSSLRWAPFFGGYAPLVAFQQAQPASPTEDTLWAVTSEGEAWYYENVGETPAWQYKATLPAAAIPYGPESMTAGSNTTGVFVVGSDVCNSPGGPYRNSSVYELNGSTFSKIGGCLDQISETGEAGTVVFGTSYANANGDTHLWSMPISGGAWTDHGLILSGGTNAVLSLAAVNNSSVYFTSEGENGGFTLWEWTPSKVIRVLGGTGNAGDWEVLYVARDWYGQSSVTFMGQGIVNNQLTSPSYNGIWLLSPASE